MHLNNHRQPTYTIYTQLEVFKVAQRSQRIPLPFLNYHILGNTLLNLFMFMFIRLFDFYGSLVSLDKPLISEAASLIRTVIG